MNSKLRTIFLFVNIFAIIMGSWLMYIGYEKTQKVSNFQSNDNSVTIIELSNNKSKINAYIVIGVILISVALTSVLIITTSLLKKPSTPKLEDKLTNQEKVVINLIKKGMTNKEIASELNVSLSTVKTHINNIYKKSEVKNRQELLTIV